MDSLEWCKGLFDQVLDTRCDPLAEGVCLRTTQSSLITDMKALYDVGIMESTADCQDKRTSLAAAAMKQQMRATFTAWRWVSSEREMGDGLTNVLARHFLAGRLKRGMMPITTD